MANAITLLSSTLLAKPTSSLTFRIQIRPSRAKALAMAPAVGTKVTPAVIVGGGRVGRALQDMGNGDDLLIKRGDSVPLDFNGPIFVCTRNDDLEAVLEATHRSRWNE